MLQLQEADYYQLLALRDGAMQLMHVCAERHDAGYVQQVGDFQRCTFINNKLQVLTKSTSCPMGFEDRIKANSATFDD